MAWMKPVRRVTPPALTPALIRAIAAVAGTPPKKGMIRFPSPCTTSS